MSLCVRCSTPNPDSAGRCSKCGAVLPRVAGSTGESDQLFSVEEGRVYPTPTETFDTENLAQLRMAIDDYLAGGEPAPVRTWLRHIRTHFQHFSTHGVDQLNQALDVERQLNAEGDFHHNVGYLVRKGIGLCEDGLSMMERALEGEDDEALMSALGVFRQGNDHICSALLMISDRQEMLEQAVAKYAPPDDEAEQS